MSTTTPRKPIITTANLKDALNKKVALERKFLGEGLSTLPLRQLTKPEQGKTFTEVYFTTASGSIYRICKRPVVRGDWVLQGKREDFIRPDYTLRPFDLNHGTLSVNNGFNFGLDSTSPVLAILAVDTNHAFTAEHVARHSNAASNVRDEFENFGK